MRVERGASELLDEEAFTRARDRMVDNQLVAREISAPAVLGAFREVKRETFVEGSLANRAYWDRPLPIGFGQTISQPYIVARTVEALDLSPGDRVLEIGTGSGYEAAILSRLAGEVYTIERLEPLAEVARARLGHLANVTVACGDGTLGWPSKAPFDAIAVSAGGPSVPRALLAQLKDGGRLVIPVGAKQGAQWLLRITRNGTTFQHESMGAVRFVPLVGEQGWPGND